MSLEEISFLGLKINIISIILTIFITFVIMLNLNHEEKELLDIETSKVKKNYFTLLYYLIPFYGIYYILILFIISLKNYKNNHQSIIYCLKETERITDFFKINKLD